MSFDDLLRWFVNAHAKFILYINIQRRELYLGDFVKYTFNIGSCSDSYGQISFKVP